MGVEWRPERQVEACVFTMSGPNGGRSVEVDAVASGMLLARGYRGELDHGM
ncbi:MAG: hypothetical protein M3Q29_04710 [Chloroflexota bacterium]|nr:hypothetical protein [Chloroflexota bacterium]